jgi:hypothetical protein
MKRFKSILCASLLTLAVSSSAFAGNITGKKGNITGAPSSIAGDIHGVTGAIYAAILGLLIP